MYDVVFLLFLFLRKTTIKAANPASPDVMKENQEYIRKRRPINFTLPELEKEIDEENEGIDYQILDPMPGTSRSLPSRSCKTSINYDDKSSDDEPEEEAKLNKESTKNPPVLKIMVMIQIRLIGTLLEILITILIWRMNMNHGIAMALLPNQTNCNSTIIR